MAVKLLHGSAATCHHAWLTVCKLSFLSVSLQRGLQLYINFAAFMVGISFPLWLSAGWPTSRLRAEISVSCLSRAVHSSLVFVCFPIQWMCYTVFRLLYVAWITPSWRYELTEVIILKLLGRYADRNFGITDNRWKIKLIEGNAKCRHLKKLTCKETLWQVFICLRPRTQNPPLSHTVYV